MTDKINKINKLIDKLIDDFQKGDETAYFKLQAIRQVHKILTDKEN